MVTPESYRTFLQQIVDQHLSDETEIFEEVADEAIEKAFKLKGLNHQAETTEGLGAADWANSAIIIGIVPTILGCYKLILEISKLKKELKPIDEVEIKEKWEKQLRQYKIGAEKAKLIADDFVKDLIGLAK